MSAITRTTAQDDGGQEPVHPQVIEFAGPTNDPISGRMVPAGTTQRHVFTGLCLRDYFIAHAPSHAPKWFMPVMPPCPIVPSRHKLPFDDFKIELNTFYNGNKERHELTLGALSWVEDRETAEVAQEEWQAEFRRECYAQWPCAWADMMLKQRAK